MVYEDGPLVSAGSKAA